MTLTNKPNAWVAVETDPQTTLTYAPRVDPAPLTVSVPGRNPTMGSLTVVITNGTVSDVQVASVTFTVVVGTPGQEGSPLMPTTAGAGITVSDTTTWSFKGPASPVTSGTADFVLAPATGDTATLSAGGSVYVQIYDFQTVPTPSTSTITIAEAIGTSDPVFTTFSVSTFPDGFFFDSLIPTVKSGSSLIPVAQVTTGASVTLTWNSSIVDTENQTVYYSNATTGQQKDTPKKLGEWPSPALTSDTVFAVVVEAQGTGGEPLTAALVTEVSVQNPSLVATSLSTGTATINGAASVGGALTANAVTATGVTVNGALAANGVTVNGALSAASGTIGGALSAASGSLSGALTVGGALSATSSASISNLTVSGGLNARSASVQMLGPGSLIWSGTNSGSTALAAYSPTDGFAVVQIDGPGDNGKSSFAYGSIYAVSRWFTVLGGTVGSFGSGWSDVMNNNNNSNCIPTPAGTWYYCASNAGGNQLDATIYVYWFPLGATSSQAMARTLSPAELAGLGLTAPEPPAIDLAYLQAEREAAADAFVSRLAEAVGADLDPDTKEALAAELLRV